MEEKKAEVRAQYGENRKITDGQYDRPLAVKCVNGTFVGRKSEGVITYKGIPFVGKQPVGVYRWKAPVDFEPDDGVYEAYYNAKSAHQMLDLSETASLYYQGEDCLYLDIWTTGNGAPEKKPVIVWIHGGGYVLGGTVDPMYDCCDFSKRITTSSLSPSRTGLASSDSSICPTCRMTRTIPTPRIWGFWIRSWR